MDTGSIFADDSGQIETDRLRRGFTEGNEGGLVGFGEKEFLTARSPDLDARDLTDRDLWAGRPARRSSPT